MRAITPERLHEGLLEPYSDERYLDEGGNTVFGMICTNEAFCYGGLIKVCRGVIPAQPDPFVEYLVESPPEEAQFTRSRQRLMIRQAVRLRADLVAPGLPNITARERLANGTIRSEGHYDLARTDAQLRQMVTDAKLLTGEALSEAITEFDYATSAANHLNHGRALLQMDHRHLATVDEAMLNQFAEG